MGLKKKKKVFTCSSCSRRRLRASNNEQNSRYDITWTTKNKQNRPNLLSRWPRSVCVCTVKSPTNKSKAKIPKSTKSNAVVSCCLSHYWSRSSAVGSTPVWDGRFESRCWVIDGIVELFHKTNPNLISTKCPVCVNQSNFCPEDTRMFSPCCLPRSVFEQHQLYQWCYAKIHLFRSRKW